MTSARTDSKESVDPATLEHLSPHDLIALLLAQEARHAAEMAAMQARIAELERRLSLNSSNSGKPPSSDKPGEKAGAGQQSAGTLRQEAGRPESHPGETLCRTETPDAIIDHYPPRPAPGVAHC